jgi:iron complex outermembrane receptor protein
MTLTATYTLPTSAGDFALNGSLYHNSGFFWEPDNRFTQPRYDLLNTTLSWTSPDKKYDIKVYARNLLNAYYYSYFSESSRGDSGSPEMPRNYGAAVSVHF